MTSATAYHRFDLFKMLGIALVLPLLGTLVSATLLVDWRLQHTGGHAFLEWVGAITALVTILLIVTNERALNLSKSEITWMAAALVCMGTLDIFHAVAAPGNNFVWFHSLATCFGGVLFAGLWWPLTRLKQVRVIGLCAFMLALALVAWPYLQPSSVPTMLTESGDFSVTSRLLNIGGGLGFLLACWYLYRRFSITQQSDYYLLSAHCLLFGVAGVLFELSVLWDAQWWWWHLLRLAAYLILLLFFLHGLGKKIDSYNAPAKLFGSRPRPQGLQIRGTQAVRLLLAAALLLGPFLTDIYMPLGFAGGTLYIPFIFCSLWSQRANAAFVLTVVASSFIILGYLKSPVADTAGGIVFLNRIFSIMAICFTAVIISIQKKTHNALAARETTLNAVIDNTQDGIISIDDSGQIIAYNKACQSIFGYTREQAIGQNVRLLMPEPDASRHDHYLDNYYRSGQAKIIGQLRVVQARRNDGESFPMELAVTEILAERKPIFTGVVRDISIRQRVEQEREQLITELKRSNEELDDFAYIASHDLKEPLRAIHNHSRFLLEDYGGQIDDTCDRRLNRLVFLTKKMETLIDDLLYFSRLGRAELAVESVDLGKVAEEVIQTLADYLQECCARVIIIDTLPEITCDRVRVAELFRNLITNAIRYNDSPHKRIQIGAHSTFPVTIYVKDNGIGIAPEFHTDVFRIFKRLNSDKAYGPGTGSGLTFVHKIVHRHGGRIWIESEPGQGTTFLFTLAA